MAAIEVRTQKELDGALKDIAEGDWIVCLGGTRDSPLRVRLPSDSATVRASGSATVEAYDSATVRAYGSATVRAYEAATVRAYGSATVRAYGSATVHADGSATVAASDSATVRAYGSATVRASGSATVRAYEAATVEASKFVAVHRHGTKPKITGGMLIQVPDLAAGAPAADWLDFHGLVAKRGIVTLFKAVTDEWAARHNGILYEPGSKPEAPDWNDRPVCGGGLHMCARPLVAKDLYHPSATRFVGCPVRVEDIVVIDSQKVKVPRVARAVFEVDRDGERRSRKLNQPKGGSR